MAKSAELDRAMQLFRDLVKPDQEASVENLRTWYDELCMGFEVAADAEVEEVDAGGVRCLWVSAPGASRDAAIVFFHGGGYVLGCADGYKDWGYALSAAAGVRVLLVDYRRAPEHAFPAQLEDAQTVYRWLLSEGIDASRITLAGDSAGGGLTMSTLVALRDAGERMPACGVLFSPWVDVAGEGESMDARAHLDPIVSRDMITNLGAAFLQGQDPKDPRASALYADLSGLPPLLCFVGTAEVLHDDAIRLDQKVRDQGGDITLEVYEDMPHVWPLFNSFLPEGGRAIEHVGRFVGERTGAAAA